MEKDLNWAVLGTGVIAKVYDSIDEVFVDDEVDIIYITTPHNTHYEFMKAGRGCELEKGITNWFRRAGNHLIKKWFRPDGNSCAFHAFQAAKAGNDKL